MAHAASTRTHRPTVLAVSSYGTAWLLDAGSGAVLWHRVNGRPLAAIDHGGELIYQTRISRTPIRRDTQKPMSWAERVPSTHLTSANACRRCWSWAQSW